MLSLTMFRYFFIETIRETCISISKFKLNFLVCR